MGVVPVNYLQSPAFIVNEALDILGQSGKIIGDITDGTPVAEAARRIYGQGLRQLLRTALWDFARRRVKLDLLGDATGNTPLPVSPFVETPWTYAYAWPTDAVMGRWMPWMPTTAQPVNTSGIPLTTGVSVAPQYQNMPGRFLVASSDQYPIEVGEVDWEQMPDLQRTEGLGPINRKIILTDCANADFVYTRLVTVIEEWDSLFRNAFVTMIALAIAPTALEDPKERMAEVARLTPTLKNAIDNARVANGNETGFPQSVDFEASFIRARNWGRWGAFGEGFAGTVGDGFGVFGGGGSFDSLAWMGSVY